MNEGPAADLWLVGAGNMGGSMLRRWVDTGVDPRTIIVIDPGTPSVPDGVQVFADGWQAGMYPATIVLAVKPQQLEAAARAILPAMPGQPAMLISILAGVEEATLMARFGADATVRAMPNLPVSLGKGVVALHSNTADAQSRQLAERWMHPLGLVEWVEEEPLFDVVTALAGSGPGFLYRYIDAMTQAGVSLGLPADQAARMTLATVEGSAMLAAMADASPAALADRVASPGGSTREGLDVLDRDGVLLRLFADALLAATHRNREMAEAARSDSGEAA